MGNFEQNLLMRIYSDNTVFIYKDQKRQYVIKDKSGSFHFALVVDCETGYIYAFFHCKKRNPGL